MGIVDIEGRDKQASHASSSPPTSMFIDQC